MIVKQISKNKVQIKRTLTDTIGIAQRDYSWCTDWNITITKPVKLNLVNLQGLLDFIRRTY